MQVTKITDLPRPAAVSPAAPVLAKLIGGATHTWASRALCAQTDPELFYSDSPAQIAQAKDVCRRCPVQHECLAHALATEEDWGVWGGLDRDERRQILRRTPRTGGAA
jgi:WhiB family redox-sensing transcriptional regulator